MRASTNYGHAYYGCRRDVADDARCPGSRKEAREDRLLPWAEALFEHLEALQYPDFADTVKALRSRLKQSPDALAQLDRTLERLQKLFLWQHISEAEYERERARFQDLRAELTASVFPRRTLDLQGATEAWRNGNSVRRRELLAYLFAGLILRDGMVVEYVARPELEAVVKGLMDRLDFPNFAKCGKGGLPSVSQSYVLIP